MKKKMIALALILLVMLPGCGEKEGQQEPSTKPSETLTVVPGTEPQPSVEASSPTEPSGDAKPNVPEYYDTYHSGKPYTPWGVQQTFTLTLNNGRSVTFTGNIPEASSGVPRRTWLWWTSTDDMKTSYMLAYIDGEQYAIQSVETFFDDMGDDFTEDIYKEFRLVAQDAVLDVRGTDSVRKNGIKMNRVIGSVQWHSKSQLKEDSFVAYVFQTPDNGYLCFLFQSTKKDWPGTQEAAENFVNTFRWEG